MALEERAPPVASALSSDTLPTNEEPAPVMRATQREQSLDFIPGIDDFNDREAEVHHHPGSNPTRSYQYYFDEDDLNLPPGRMNATRVPQRLCGSASHLVVPPGLPTILQEKSVIVARIPQRRGSTGSMSSHSSASARKRSKSPSMRHEYNTTTTHDANSSISSLEEYVDSDILYDRAGMEELDATSASNNTLRKLHNSREFTNLPPVSERLSEETLEDVHAFSDVSRNNPLSSNASRGNSTTTGMTNDAVGLEPLNECDDEDDLDQITEEGEEGGDARPSTGGVTPHPQTVILTNLDNLSIVSKRAGGAEGSTSAAGGAPTGESSLMEEAPSADP